MAQIITRDPTGTVGARDPLRLSRYLEAYALNSAGITEAKSIYQAAGIDRGTAVSYERVLENVFVVESLPAWRTSRLKRLALAPKRYVMDAGLMAAILRTDAQAILHDGKLLGRVIDAFVTQRLRDELGDRFVAGAVFHAGAHAFPLGERITALPISAIWAA